MLIANQRRGQTGMSVLLRAPKYGAEAKGDVEDKEIQKIVVVKKNRIAAGAPSR